MLTLLGSPVASVERDWRKRGGFCSRVLVSRFSVTAIRALMKGSEHIYYWRPSLRKPENKAPLLLT